MTRIQIAILTVATSLVAILYLAQIPRYRAEEDALAEIATLTESSVKYTRVEGLAGVQYVNTIWLQPDKLSDARISDLGPYLKSLPRVRMVVIEPEFASKSVLDALRARYSDVEFSGSVGFSWKPNYKFAYPRIRS